MGGRPLRDERTPPWPGLDDALASQFLDRALRGGAAHVVLGCQPVKAWQLLTGQQFAFFDLPSQIGGDAQVWRQLFPWHLINIPSTGLTCADAS